MPYGQKLENLRSGSEAGNRTQKKIQENLRNLQLLGTLAFVTLGVIGWATYSYLTDPARPIPTSDCPGGFSRVSTISGLETPIPAAIEGPENFAITPLGDLVRIEDRTGTVGYAQFDQLIPHSNPKGDETFIVKPQTSGRYNIDHTTCRK